MDNERAYEAMGGYAQAVGERLRAIRHQRGSSLQEVEAATAHEFKASVLGAYERGERIISVPRLQRLADHYGVPVDQLLPAPRQAARRQEGDTAPIRFDLSRLEEMDDAELNMIRQYLYRIQLMRQDFNGRVLTIRHDDVETMAGMFGIEPMTLIRRFDELELRLGT